MIFTWPLAVPRLENEELLLLPWAEVWSIENVEDDLLVSCQDPQMVQFTWVPVPYTRNMAREFLGASAVRWALVVQDRYCGNIEVRLESARNRIVDVGYSTTPWARGKGYMTRALALVMEHAFANGVHRFVCRAATNNPASRRVAEANGLIFEGVERGSELLREQVHDLAVYARLASDPPLSSTPHAAQQS